MNIQFRIFDEESDGAALDIERNTIYRAGNSMDFDVYLPFLPTENEGKHYFDFSIDEQGVTFLKNTDVVTRINLTNNAREQIEEMMTYDFPCLFEYMGVQLALCDAKDTWEKWLQLVKQSQLNSHKNESEVPAMSEAELRELDRISPDQSPAASMENPSVPLPIGPVGKAIEFLKSKNLWPQFIVNLSEKDKKLFQFVVGICGFLFAMIIIFSLISHCSFDGLQGKRAASAGDIQSIKHIEVNLPTRFSNLKFLTNNVDMFSVTGVVKDADDIQFLKKSFEKYDKYMKYKLITSDDVITKLNLIMKSLNVSNITAGYNATTSRVYLSGLLANLDSINDIEVAVGNQIPEIGDVDTSQVYSYANVSTDLDALMAKDNASSRLSVQKEFDKKNVLITGYLSQDELASFKADVEALNSKYNGILTFNLDIKDVAKSLPFTIVSVDTGGFPSFMTDDGQKVFEGGVIAGMKVEKITPSEIIFSGKFPLVYKLDGGSVDFK